MIVNKRNWILYIYSDDNRILIKEDEIKEMQNNFHKFYSRNPVRGVGIYCRTIMELGIKN